MQKIFVVEHSAWRQIKENYPINLPYQFHWRPQSALGDPQLSHKKMKTPFLSNMSKSRRLTSTFFPTTVRTVRPLEDYKQLNLMHFSISTRSVSSSHGLISRIMLDLAMRAGFLDFFSAYAAKRSA